MDVSHFSDMDIGRNRDQVDKDFVMLKGRWPLTDDWRLVRHLADGTVRLIMPFDEHVESLCDHETDIQAKSSKGDDSQEFSHADFFF